MQLDVITVYVVSGSIINTEMTCHLLQKSLPVLFRAGDLQPGHESRR